MKKIIKQSLKAIGYFVLFLASQFIVSFGFIFFYGFKTGMEIATSGGVMDQEKVAMGASEFLLGHVTETAILSGLFTLFCLWIFSLMRNKKLFRELKIKGFSTGYFPIVVLMGAAVALMIQGILSLLPEVLLEAYMNQAQNIVNASLPVTILATVIVAPIVEEIVFRELILSALRKAMPLPVAIVLSTLLFAVSHGQLLWICYTFVLGVVLCVIRVKTGTCSASILVHAVFNLFGGILLPLIVPEDAIAMNIIIAGIGVVSVCVLMTLLLKKKDVQSKPDAAIGGEKIE